MKQSEHLCGNLFKGIVADDIYNHLEENEPLPEEQKGCRSNSRGAKDQLLIGEAVMKNCSGRKIVLSMVWIDYRKAYDMIPHSFITKSMEMCGVVDNISHLFPRVLKAGKRS